MANANRLTKQLFGWVKKQIHLTRKQGRCTRIVLHHVGTAARLGPEVETVNVGEGLSPDEDITDVVMDGYVSDIIEAAEAYAEGIGSTQTFCVAGYFEDAEQAVSRHTFRVNVEGMIDTGDVGSEPATEAGLTKQLMRHLESIQRMNMQFSGQIMHTMVKENERLSTQVETMQESYVEALQTMEELSTQKHTRDLALKEKDHDLQTRAKLIDAGTALLPALANKVIGAKILPETTDPLKMQIVKLAQALSPGEMEGIMNAIQNPALKIAFYEVLSTVASEVGTADAAAEHSDENSIATTHRQ